MKFISLKKTLLSMGIILAVIAGCTSSELDEDIEDRFEELEDRVEKLEEICSKLNTNISSIQKVLKALEDNDYVTSIVPIKEEGKTIGWSLEFSKSGPLTIYDGKDGHSP